MARRKKTGRKLGRRARKSGTRQTAPGTVLKERALEDEPLDRTFDYGAYDSLRAGGPYA